MASSAEFLDAAAAACAPAMVAGWRRHADPIDALARGLPGRERGRAVLTASTLCGWLEDARRPLLVIDDQLTVHWMNAVSRKRLASQPDLTIRRDRLAFADPAAAELLRGRLPTCGGEVSICLSATKSGEHILIKASRASGDDGRPLFMMTFTRTDDPVAQFAHVEEVFGLTQAEARVLGHLVQGRTADEAARAEAVKIETVRTHIKGIYGKVGVSSREALFRRLLPFRT